MANITIDDVYEIAAEVAEETITKFLTNLVKLVPNAGDITESIKEAQYNAYRSAKKGVAKKVNTKKREWDEDVEDNDEEDDYMRRVYEEGQSSEDDDYDDTEAEFDEVAGHGKKGAKKMSDIFPDEMEAKVGLKDDMHMPSQDPAED